jgi:hypothetical protein
MVRRRSTVRFRNGALAHKLEKRHPIRLEADRVAFSLLRLSTALAGLLRLFLDAPLGDGVLHVKTLGVDL